MDSPHKVERGMPADWTPMNGARACWAIIASCEPSPRTPIRRQPRRTASAAAAIVSSVPPQQATAITTSPAGAPPGGGLVVVHREGLRRAAAAAEGRQHIAGDPGATHARDHDRAWAAGGDDLSQVGLLGGAHGGPHLRSRGGHLAEYV